jgi:CRP-like cAMP-binding protein
MGSVAQFVAADVALSRLSLLAGGGREADAALSCDQYRRESLVKGADLASPDPALILGGWACQTTTMANGDLRCIGFLLPGDVIDAAYVAAASGRHIHAITPIAIARHDALSAAMTPAHPCGLYGAVHQLCEARRLDHIVRLSTMQAYAAVAHLFMELHDRMASVGLVSGGRFNMPLSQRAMAMFLGMSGVHVNRTLQQLVRDKLVWTGPGWAEVSDPAQLAEKIGCASSFSHLSARRAAGPASADSRRTA